MTLYDGAKSYLQKEEVLSHRLKLRMKELEIGYLEMSLQIGVSLSTFKRMINNPFQAKHSQLVALIHELGGNVCIEL